MFFNERYPVKNVLHDAGITTGIKNYELFLNNPFFKWPLWVNASFDAKSKYFRQIINPFINNVAADIIPFTNFLSSEKLMIDFSGMLSVSYADWSFEIWFIEDGKLFRPQENADRVKISRNHTQNITSFISKSGKMHLTETVFGARTDIDEAIIEIDCSNSGASDSYVIVALRPYNFEKLGSVKKAEFIKDELIFKINGLKYAAVDQPPDYIISENASAPFNFSMEHLSSKSSCADGLASVAAVYKVNKTGRKIYLRIGLDDKKYIKDLKSNYKEIKDEFISYSGAVLKSGFKLTISDTEFQKWFYFLKISCLNIRRNGLLNSIADEVDYKKSFWAIHGFNRMGYFRESISIADTQIKSLIINPKKIKNSDTINSCYLILSVADIFIKSRDSEFLQSVFFTVKDKISFLLGISSKIKRIADIYGGEADKKGAYKKIYDVMLICRSMKQAAYLARCMGIFGDENRFQKENTRLESLIKSYLKKYSSGDYNPDEELFIADLFSIYPFRILSAGDEASHQLIDKIKSVFGTFPVYLKSRGIDLFSTAAAANAMFMIKHPDANQTIKAIMDAGKTAYSLSSYINPQSGAAIYTDDSSSIMGSVFFSAIRNSLFIDYPESLDIFPVPNSDWFNPGFEIVIENAPSRFGILCIRVLSTETEVQIQFDNLPKFIPPQLIINLPFKAKIQEGEDFILKKEQNGSFFLNGWPSIVRFVKK